MLIALLALGAAVLIHGLGDKNSLLAVIGAGDAGLALLFLLAEPFVRWWTGNLLARASKAEAAGAPGQPPES